MAHVILSHCMIPYLVRKKARIVYDFMLSKSKQCLLPCHNCSRTCSDLMLNKNTKTYGALTSLCRYKVSNNLSCMYFFLSSNRFYLLFRDIVHEIFSHMFATTVLFRGYSRPSPKYFIIDWIDFLLRNLVWLTRLFHNCATN